MTNILTSTSGRTRGFVALMLLTAGALVLAGRAWPIAADALPLVLGIELLCWAYVARDDGPLTAGGVLTGVGTGVLLAAGPLVGSAPHTVGGAIVTSVGVGFAVVAALSRLWLHEPQRWAWITAVAMTTVGAGLLAGGTVLAGLFTWGLPAALLLAGTVAALRWRRAS